MEVIESDFARLEADTKSSEAAAQKEYDSFMTDSKVDKEAKSTDIEHKTAKKQDESQALTVKGEDLEGTQKELDAALAYFDKLKPSCVDSGVSYEDRVARRKEEIESSFALVACRSGFGHSGLADSRDFLFLCNRHCFACARRTVFRAHRGRCRRRSAS